jgi:hypothetical protein
MLITVGILFTLDHFTQYTFWDKTWPALIIVIGLLSLARRGFDAQQPPPADFPPPQYAYPQYPPAPVAPQSSYAQSPYAQTSPSKGGFGASAPPKPDAAQTTTEPPPPPSGSGSAGGPQ